MTLAGGDPLQVWRYVGQAPSREGCVGEAFIDTRVVSTAAGRLGGGWGGACRSYLSFPWHVYGHAAGLEWVCQAVCLVSKAVGPGRRLPY